MSFKMHLAGRPSVPWSQAAPQWSSQGHGPRPLLSGQVKVSWLEAKGEQVTCHNLLVKYRNSA